MEAVRDRMMAVALFVLMILLLIIAIDQRTIDGLRQPMRAMDAVSGGRWCWAWVDGDGCIWYAHEEDGVLLMDEEIEQALKGRMIK